MRPHRLRPVPTEVVSYDNNTFRVVTVQPNTDREIEFDPRAGRVILVATASMTGLVDAREFRLSSGVALSVFINEIQTGAAGSVVINGQIEGVEVGSKDDVRPQSNVTGAEELIEEEEEEGAVYIPPTIFDFDIVILDHIFKCMTDADLVQVSASCPELKFYCERAFCKRFRYIVNQGIEPADDAQGNRKQLGRCKPKHHP